MKTRIVGLSSVLLALVLAGGCVARAGLYGTGTVVYTAPPPPRVVVRASAPAPEYVWYDGYWDWNGRAWIWVDGRWVQPRAGYVYVQPRWHRQGRGWVHADGGWRPHRGRVEVARPAQGHGPGPGNGRPSVEVRGR